MTWRIVVIDRTAKLDLQMGYMVVRRGTNVSKIHLSELNMLIVESTAVSLTVALLSELITKKVKIIFCDEKRNPIAELLPYYGSHDTSDKIRRQIKWDKDLKKKIWTAIVTEKIRKQEQLLQSLDKESYVLLSGYIDEIRFGDITNREGHAAKVYFNALFGMDFTRGSDTAINAALNYGYTILLSAFNREVAANGYLTQLGLFHDNGYNPFNLSSDLMEPYRPLVDRMVYEMSPECFGTQEKHQMISLMNQFVWIRERQEYISNAIKIYVKSVFDALSEKDPTLIRFYENEL